VLVKQRDQASNLYPRAMHTITTDHNQFIKQLHDALYAATIIVYAQGMSLLASASEEYAYQLDLETVARIWRGGCIIRARLLEDIRSAFRLQHNLPSLLLDPNLAKKMMAAENNLRQVVSHAGMSGLPIPAFMVSLSYLDAYRSSWLPANLIQAQRDYFGAHTYERINEKGTFHTEWEKDTSS
jgi:6-phosphogluconate dehydrogenase